MKKRIKILILFTVFIGCQSLLAQNFNNIIVNGSKEIDLVPKNANVYILNATADNFPKVIIKNDGEKMVLDEGYLYENNYESLSIQFENKPLQVFTLNGSGVIRSAEPLAIPKAEIQLIGSGDIDLYLTSDTIKLAIVGSGTVKLHGTAKYLNINLTGSGDIDARELNTTTTIINISGSGNATVNTNTLNAKVSGFGNVYYTNRATSIIKEIKGCGDVRMR